MMSAIAAHSAAGLKRRFARGAPSALSRVLALVAGTVDQLVRDGTPRRRWVAAIRDALALRHVVRSSRQICRDLAEIATISGPVNVAIRGKCLDSFCP